VRGRGKGARIEDAIQNSSSGAEAAHGAIISVSSFALCIWCGIRSETGRMDTALRSLLPGLTGVLAIGCIQHAGENLYETLISIAGL